MAAHRALCEPASSHRSMLNIFPRQRPQTTQSGRKCTRRISYARSAASAAAQRGTSPRTLPSPGTRPGTHLQEPAVEEHYGLSGYAMRRSRCVSFC